METSASFEARSAPSSYPTAPLASRPRLPRRACAIVNWHGALVCVIKPIAHGRARGQEQGVEVKSLPRSLSRDAPPMCRRERSVNVVMSSILFC
jgi:hypothetical protein